MLDFLSVFHAECSHHHLGFTHWKESVLSESGLTQSSCSDLSDEFKVRVRSDARSIFYGVQQVMIRYEDVTKLMNDEGEDDNNN